MATITPLSGISPIGTATSEGSSRNPGRETFASRGEVFKALVAEVRGNNIFLLDINGTKLPVESNVPLKIGQTLTLQISGITPSMEFRILSDPQNLFHGRSLLLLGNAIDVKSLVQLARNSLHTPFQSLSAQTVQTLETYVSHAPENLLGKDAGHLLKELVGRLGISMESLLLHGRSSEAHTTLKSALLELNTVFQQADELAEKTHALLTTIELYQLAHLNLEKEGLLIFPLPLSFLKKGYLTVEQDTKEKSVKTETKETRFNLNLCLEGLGNLKIECVQYENGVYLRFFAENQEKATFIKDESEKHLAQSLSTNILGVQWSITQTDPSADLLKKVMGERETLVNTKI